MEVSLREITAANWQKCYALKPGESQQHFVAPNGYSMLQGIFQPDCTSLAIYAGEQMVGYTLYGFDPPDKSYWVYRLMIDEKEQGKGYGRAALRQVIERVRHIPDCSQLVITWVPGNDKGENLYLSLGFQKTGEEIEGEIVARLYF